MGKIINVGLIGYGIGGQVFHAPVLTSVEGLSLKKIRVTDPVHAALARQRYPGAEIVKNSNDIINDKDIDLVVIAAPNILHFNIAAEALRAGKHVVTDKPFTVSSKEADELIILANKNKKILSVFHSRRFDSDFKTVQKIINSGLLGNLVEMESHYDRFRNILKPGAWREENIPGSGLLYDLGSHLIDQSLVLFGLPHAVTAFINKQRPGSRTDDNFEVILHYLHIKVSLKAGMLVPEPLMRFLLLGDCGSFIKKGMDVQEGALKAGLIPAGNSNWGAEPDELRGTINTTVKDIRIQGKVESEKGDYCSYYRNIQAAITGNEQLLVTAAGARDVIRIIELALLSEQEKRTKKFTHN